MASRIGQSATGNKYIDGLLSGNKWNGNFTFSFPQAASDYQSGNAETATFTPVSFQEREATRAILTGQTFDAATTNVMHATSVNSFISLSVSEAGGLGNGLNGSGDMRIAQSPSANPTAYGYYPNNNANGNGGDVWFGDNYAGTSNDYRNPVLGNYAYLTHIHEFGHAMGLKHAHETGGVSNVAVPSDRDAIEFAVMSYRSYVGGPSSGGYTFGQWDAPQTYMQYDILALQTMYGAYYGSLSNNTNTSYAWDPATGQMFINGVGQGTPGGNRVFLTIWDGGGTDTYDMSNYSTGVTIDLSPGGWSITSNSQRANLGSGHQANGNVYNSLLFGGDTRSIIENAIGGSGNDSITGNQVNNVLTGNGGNDSLSGLGGNDTLQGGDGADTLNGGTGNDLLIGNAGTDTAVYVGGSSAYQLLQYNGTIAVLTHGSEGQDRLQTLENIQFTNTTVSSTTATTFDPYEYLASYADLRGVFGSNIQYVFDHYVDYGFAENRVIDAFDNWSYLASYGDLIAVFHTDTAAAAQHFVQYGAHEGRIADAFSEWDYFASYNDLISVYGSNVGEAAQHYVRYGYSEGRVADAFSEWDYVATYNDLITAFGTQVSGAAQHFVQYGFHEGRIRDGFAEWEYLASNSDLIMVYGTHVEYAAQHFVSYGFNEGRSRDTFNDWEYLASNADLIQVIGANEPAAVEHYVSYGFNEHRSVDSFNAAQYLANYADLRAVYGNDQSLAAWHYVAYGYREGRTDHILQAPPAGDSALPDTQMTQVDQHAQTHFIS